MLGELSSRRNPALPRRCLVGSAKWLKIPPSQCTIGNVIVVDDVVLAVDDDGNLLVLESNKDSGGRLAKYLAETKFKSRTPIKSLYKIADAGGLALYKGDLYMADKGNQVVLKFPNQGGKFGPDFSIVAGKKLKPGPRLDQLRAPTSIAFNAENGNMYVTDSGNDRVLMLGGEEGRWLVCLALSGCDKDKF